MAVGYRAYQGARGSFVSAVIPVFEAHLNTPLNHRGTRTEPAGYVDQLTLLGGVHGILWNRTILGTAVGAPVTGPRPFSLQATFQLNHTF